MLKKLQTPSGAVSGEESRLIEEVIRNALGMREIVKERTLPASVIMKDMFYPLSLHGWGGTRSFHPINMEYPGIQVQL